MLYIHYLIHSGEDFSGAFSYSQEYKEHRPRGDIPDQTLARI